MNRALAMTFPNPNRICDSADFAPLTYATRGAKLTGIASSKVGTVSVWARIDGGDGLSRFIFTTTNFQFSLNTSNKFVAQGTSATPANVLGIASNSACVAGAAWRHILCSWDLATAGSGRFYLNDVTDYGVETNYVNDLINFGGDTDASVGANPAGSLRYDGCLAELWFDTRYTDFNLVANRRKFISSSGRPVHLGTTGALPFGADPLVYFHLDDGEAVGNFVTNRGAGGNFTVASGTLATGSTSPSD